MERDVKLMSQQRFGEEANIVYRIPYNSLPRRQLNAGTEPIDMIDFEDDTMKKIIISFINHHKEYQVPRLKELKRYYMADNNINYRPKKSDEYRADNRIASDFAKFVVTFNQSVVVGNPVAYTGEGKIAELISEFAERTNDQYHNRLMVKDCGIYGRGYEQVYRDEYSEENVARLDPEETFVVYDAAVNGGSLFSVRYYNIKVLDKTKSIVEISSCDGRKTIF